MANNNWTDIKPEVNGSAEFFEIVNDFGDPMELVREAISNAVDWKASHIKVSFNVENINGSKRLVVCLSDDGVGMTNQVLSTAFWGLGHSESRKLKANGDGDLIGEKGHGTKIYLRSEEVQVRTKSEEGCFESVCPEPFKALSNEELHKPQLREIDNFIDDRSTGTEIRIIGYNDNERSAFIQDIVRDYIKWFTKVGSIEHVFGIEHNKDFKIYLKCLDADEFEEISFGHTFPEENSSIDSLFEELEFDAADHYVKRFIYANERLKNHPEVTFDLVVSVEGDQAKRKYNPMIQERSRKETGRYKVSDRYGIWICKDHIPITRVNEWISGFGTGSNSMTMIHGFLNCQDLKLTANRGAISNTDSQIQNELKERVQEIFDDIDTYLHEKGIYTLRSWQKEHKTIKQENAEYKRRITSIKKRNACEYKGRVFLEPQNEAEVFGLFMSIYTLYPEKFLFEPLDYNTSRGIDLIARNKTDNKISESEFWYVELKFILKKDFNHAFKHLRWILCWDFDKNLSEASELIGVEESDIRYLKTEKDENNNPIYFLDKRARGGNRVEIIKLKEFLRIELGMEFK
ncbi:MAG: hypothetical protein BA867_01190 [Desulfobacterales bacterium S5133MH16]|nr:MAG: hypothetical protein BA867_01190 [Desulfobacterales bacterium S5133MH16]